MTQGMSVHEEASGGRKTGVFWWLQHVLAWLVVLFLGALIVLSVLVPRLGGATPYAVLTGSMAPGMPAGTLAVVRPVDPSRVGIGTVITYQLRSGEPTVVTHRVVSVAVDAAGERTFRTQGDANNAPDAAPVLPVQVRGALWYKVPYAGYINSVVTGKERQVAMIVVVAGLLAYSAFMFAGALRDRLSRRRAAAAGERPGAGETYDDGGRGETHDGGGKVHDDRPSLVDSAPRGRGSPGGPP